MEGFSTQIKKLKSSLESITKEKEESTNKAESEITTLTEQLEAIKTSQSVAESQLTSVTQTAVSFSRLLKSISSGNSGKPRLLTVDELESLSKEINQMKDKLKDLKLPESLTEELRSQFSTAVSENMDAIAMAAAIKKREADSDAQIKELEAKVVEVDDLQKEISTLKDQTKDSDKQATELEALQKVVEDLQTQINSKVIELAGKDDELKVKAARLEALQNEITTLKDESKDSDKQATELLDLQKVVEDLKAQIREKVTELAGKDTELKTKAAELETLQKEMRTLAEKQVVDFSTLKQEIEDLKTMINKNAEELANKDIEIQETKKQVVFV